MPFHFRSIKRFAGRISLAFPFPFTLTFLTFAALSLSWSTGCNIGVDGAARERLPLKFPRPLHAVPCQETVNTFGKPLQRSAGVVLPRSVELNDVRLQLLGITDL